MSLALQHRDHLRHRRHSRLAAGGVTLVAALRPNPTTAPSMRLALRAGLVALTGSMAAGAVMIAYGLTPAGASRATDAYQSAGFLRPAHAVTMQIGRAHV